jgi:hypothetical protein
VPLTTEQQKFLVDRILLPAARKIYPYASLQHHASNWQTADDRARARQKESVTDYARAFSELGYYLSNDPVPSRSGGMQLDLFWEEVIRQLKRRGGEQWESTQLVAVTYNTKLHLRRDSVPQLQELVENTILAGFERNHVDWDYAYVDLAYEDMAISDDGN